MKISVVLIVKNEEKRIKQCLESVKFADEIIVVDDGSIDSTVQIAKKYTSKIYSHVSKGFVEAARDFGLEKATGEWILLLDADESIPTTLATELQEKSKATTITYVKIPRKNIIFGQWILHNKGWWPDYQLRFFRKGEISWPKKIHGQPELRGEGVLLPAKEEYAIIHENYATVSQFLEKLDRYTTIEAEQGGKNTDWEEAMTRPTDEFLSRFFAREGYKDGLHGLVLSLLESFSAEVLFAKQWEKAGFYQIDDAEFLEKNYLLARNVALQYEYWYLSALLDQTKNPLLKVRHKARRKAVTRKLARTKKL